VPQPPWLAAQLRPQGISLYISQRPPIVHFVQGTRKESVLPQVAASPVESIDVLGIELIRTLERFGQRVRAHRRYNEMNMIGHQTIAVHNHLGTLGGLCQKRQKHPSVVIHEEYILAVITTLGNVMSTTCNDYSWTSRHEDKLAGRKRDVNRKIMGSVPIIFISSAVKSFFRHPAGVPGL
jgi:hypothetical protein